MCTTGLLLKGVFFCKRFSWKFIIFENKQNENRMKHMSRIKYMRAFKYNVWILRVLILIISKLEVPNKKWLRITKCDVFHFEQKWICLHTQFLDTQIKTKILKKQWLKINFSAKSKQKILQQHSYYLNRLCNLLSDFLT